jgi:hypothetical protein
MNQQSRRRRLVGAILAVVTATSLLTSTRTSATDDLFIPVLESWSNTYARVNPPSNWLSTRWNGSTFYSPPDATVTATSKVLQVSIPTTQSNLKVRFRLEKIPAKASISSDGGLKVTHGSVSAIDRLNSVKGFNPSVSASLDSPEAFSFEVGSGLGSWKNRPAYFRRHSTSGFMTVSLATAVKRSQGMRLLGAHTGGTPMAFAERGNDAWLVVNSLTFGDALNPMCRYPDGRKCLGVRKPPTWFPSSLRRSLGVPPSATLKVDTRAIRVVRPPATVGPFEEKLIPGTWNTIGDLLPTGLWSATGTNCTLEISDKNYEPLLSIAGTSGQAQIVVSTRNGELVKSSCELAHGSGESGDERSVPGIHTGLRPGLYSFALPCTEAPTQGEQILRGDYGTLIMMTGPTSPGRITSSVVRVPGVCGAFRRIGD